ncbi:hypothetical protein HZA56_19030 [Candidatus Poribacteria bacterium]|nr:hypothetical protein [Candidatus Poribacteria bacterium]
MKRNRHTKRQTRMISAVVTERLVEPLLSPLPHEQKRHEHAKDERHEDETPDCPPDLPLNPRHGSRNAGLVGNPAAKPRKTYRTLPRKRDGCGSFRTTLIST